MQLGLIWLALDTSCDTASATDCRPDAVDALAAAPLMAVSSCVRTSAAALAFAFRALLGTFSAAAAALATPTASDALAADEMFARNICTCISSAAPLVKFCAAGGGCGVLTVRLGAATARLVTGRPAVWSAAKNADASAFSADTLANSASSAVALVT